MNNEGEMILNNGSKVNLRQVNMEQIGQIHPEAISTSPEEYRANLKIIKEREASKMRLSRGKGSLDDSRAKRKALIF